MIKEMVDDSRESKECMKTINERNEDGKGQGKLERKVGKGKNGKGDGGGKERWNDTYVKIFILLYSREVNMRRYTSLEV